MNNSKYRAYHYLLAAPTTTPAPYYYTGHIHITWFVREKYLTCFSSAKWDNSL